MQHLTATDCREYDYPSEIIYETLANLPGYREWWPWGVKVKALEQNPNHLNDKIEVWASGGWFRSKITALEPYRRVEIEYYAGVVRGGSYWSISEQRTGRTKVCYCIDLKLHGLLPKLLGVVINFSKIHSWQFQRVLSSLDTYLQKSIDSTPR